MGRAGPSYTGISEKVLNWNSEELPATSLHLGLGQLALFSALYFGVNFRRKNPFTRFYLFVSMRWFFKRAGPSQP
jgi:hypothetical protein